MESQMIKELASSISTNQKAIIQLVKIIKDIHKEIDSLKAQIEKETDNTIDEDIV